jgi:CMP-N-acetylneuraminic acid synthetase
MTKNIDIFLPCRSSSFRVKNKNIKPFCDKKFGLFQIKIEQLNLIKKINKIIVSTNDIKILNYLNKKKYVKVIIDKRPDYLCQSSTSTDELIKYLPTITKTEHLLWTHVTSPFFNNKDYIKAINLYEKNLGKKDSLMGVSPVQDFIYDEYKPINFNKKKEKWPRTQTLKKLYVVNNAIFISSRKNYLKYNDRIGTKPFLMNIEKIKSFDIDWPEDFKIAEKIYETLF